MSENMTPAEIAARAEQIAKLNDKARIEGKPALTSAVMTQGVAALPPHEIAQIQGELKTYANWTRGEDTYAERDFGVLTRVTRNGVTRWTQEPQPDPKDGEPRLLKIFFKLDYYHKPTTLDECIRYNWPTEWVTYEHLTYGSPDPSNERITDRVLTVYLASDY